MVPIRARCRIALRSMKLREFTMQKNDLRPRFLPLKDSSPPPITVKQGRDKEVEASNDMDVRTGGFPPAVRRKRGIPPGFQES